ncbi:hypothetical protein CEXT_567601 [Caerostris extrusa]|uniref:Uncharacterized protein n=1 Tax=Caerostris extrusa TaxID=172846 RepID=A0AAV4SYR0_CAEEX|nr:hypothetical protein CEXT_567601 [Caerostris extrusa]
MKYCGYEGRTQQSVCESTRKMDIEMETFRPTNSTTERDEMTFGDPVFMERLNILKELNTFKRKDTIFKNRDDDIFNDPDRLMRILSHPSFPRSTIVDLVDLDDLSSENNDCRNNCPCSVYLRCQLIYTFIFGLMTLLLYTRDVQQQQQQQQQQQKQNNERLYSWLIMVALWIFGTICLFVSEHGKNTATHIGRMLGMVRNCLRWIYLCRCSEYLKFQLLCTFIFGSLTIVFYINGKQEKILRDGICGLYPLHCGFLERYFSMYWNTERVYPSI